MLLISLTACEKKASDYEAYVKSLITANYLGITDEYVDMTGSNEEDAEAIYLQNVTRLADNLSLYYGLEIATDPELAPAMVDLAKQIYGKTKFEVNRVYKDNNIYYVELTIYPIDILNQTNDQIVEYVNNFNAAVDSGKYNDYSREEYEYEFASGIIGILASAVNDIQYGEPEVLKVRIITTEDSYYIGNEDVRNIICTQPFACLPNHIVGKGVIKAIRNKHPEANIVAIDYDPGASEVNQLNRIKLMLSRAVKEL